jgi:probable F420-dependent oxidoreductase
MHFGLGVPTGTEGLMYPVPFADPDQAVRLGVDAERLGFDGVWGNDHVSTPAYVRAEGGSEAPRFYDPYVYLAFVAAETTTLRLATAVTVASFRHPVVLAKQAATLDQLSGGRFSLGIGLGAYREESEALAPGAGFHRGRHATEYLQALRALTTQRRASFAGEQLRFEDVECSPRPRQDPLPLLAGGNAPGARERAARYADGWIPGVLSPQEVADGLADIRRTATQHGRELPAGFDVAPQLIVVVGDDTADALRRFEGTHMHQHIRSLSQSTLKDQAEADFARRNLVGNAEQMLEQVRAYAAAGVTSLAGLLFAGESLAEVRDHVTWFAERVIAPYRELAQ